MDAPLAQCTREEQRAVVRFLWSEGSSGTKIHQRLLAQYGDNALSKTTVYEWIEKFKTGRTSVKHAEGAGRFLGQPFFGIQKGLFWRIFWKKGVQSTVQVIVIC